MDQLEFIHRFQHMSSIHICVENIHTLFMDNISLSL
jgi:hypothetical protein